MIIQIHFCKRFLRKTSHHVDKCIGLYLFVNLVFMSTTIHTLIVVIFKLYLEQSLIYINAIEIKVIIII